MFCEMIDDAFLVSMSGTSEGTQIKYYKDGYWYKKDSFGGEAAAEYLSSRLLTFSDLSAGDYVTYECGNLNGASACRSRNFLQEGESFITLYRFYQLSEGRKINEDLLRYETPEKRADFVLTYFSKNCALDLSEYFSRIFTLDLIILNEDRHFNNLGLISKENGTYRSAPIFDNGKSLLVGNPSVNRRLPLDENIKRVTARPFSGSHRKNMELFGKGFRLDKEKAIAWLTSEPDSYEKSVLLYQLEHLDIF